VSSGYRGFEWDPQKSERTKRLRGFDFLAARGYSKIPMLSTTSADKSTASSASL